MFDNKESVFSGFLPLHFPGGLFIWPIVGWVSSCEQQQFSTRMMWSGLLIPVSYPQLMSFPLSPCTKGISFPSLISLGVYPTCKLINMFCSILVKLWSLIPRSIILLCVSYSFWHQMHTSVLGLVFPMDVDFCIVAEWMEWDLGLFLVFPDIYHSLVSSLQSCQPLSVSL